MKQTILLLLVATTFLAGCAVLMTRYEYGNIKLDVKGQVKKGSKSLAIKPRNHKPQPSVYYSIAPGTKQVLIEAKIVSVNLDDQSFRGIGWLLPNGETLEPTRVEKDTPRSSNGGMSFGIGMGFSSGGRGYDDNNEYDQDNYRSRDRSSSGFGGGVLFPVNGGSGGGSGMFTSIRVYFDMPGTVQIDDSYLQLLIQVGTKLDGKMIVQPIVLPMSLTPKPESGANPPITPQPVTTHVLVKNDETFVIGGLTRTEQEVKSDVPILGNIPLLKSLFKNKAESAEKRNLLIFITPRIVITEE